MQNQIAASIILAGGTGRRLGGVSKPDYLINGVRLIDILLHNLSQVDASQRLVVVGPPDLNVPDHIVLTLEDPPLGGPLAGLGAGIDKLADLPDTSLIGIATCDAPRAVLLQPALAALFPKPSTTIRSPQEAPFEEHLAESKQETPIQGAVPKTNGHTHYLHGVYTLGALRQLQTKRDSAVKHAFADMELRFVNDRVNYCFDIDTPQDADLFIDLLGDNSRL